MTNLGVDAEWAQFVASAKSEKQHIDDVSRTAEALFVRHLHDLSAESAFIIAEGFHAERIRWANEFSQKQAAARVAQREGREP